MFGFLKNKDFTFGAQRLTPIREDFPDENFLQNNRVIVDIRDKESIEELGVYPNSEFIKFDKDFVDEVKKLNQSVYVLCEKGVESFDATLLLQEAGVDAVNLNGGLYYIKEVINIKPKKIKI